MMDDDGTLGLGHAGRYNPVFLQNNICVCNHQTDSAHSLPLPSPYDGSGFDSACGIVTQGLLLGFPPPILGSGI